MVRERLQNLAIYNAADAPRERAGARKQWLTQYKIIREVQRKKMLRTGVAVFCSAQE